MGLRSNKRIIQGSNVLFTELNYLQGTTSSIQSQLDNKTDLPPLPTVSGGTLIDDGDYWVRIFTTSDTLSISGGDLDFVELYAVGGGGPGGR